MTRIKGKKTLIGIVLAIVLAAAIPLSATAATSGTPPNQNGDATTTVQQPSYVTSATVDTSSTVNSSATPNPGGEPGRPSQNPIPAKPQGESLVAKALKAIVPNKKLHAQIANVSTFGGKGEVQTIVGGGKSNAKTKIVVNGKTYKVYRAFIANKSWPLGTVVQVKCHGLTAIYVVEERGPYVSGRKFDLPPRAQQDLKINGLATVHYKVLGKLKKGYDWKKFPGLLTKYTTLYK